VRRDPRENPRAGLPVVIWINARSTKVGSKVAAGSTSRFRRYPTTIDFRSPAARSREIPLTFPAEQTRMTTRSERTQST
jgi:hypothetical protein